MNKKEKIIVLILTIALVWTFYNSYQQSKKIAEEQQAAKEQQAAEQQAAKEQQADEQNSGGEEQSNADGNGIPADQQEKIDGQSEKPKIEYLETQKISVTNNLVVYTFTSKGGAIESVTLNGYPARLDGDNPVFLDFSRKPAMLVERGIENYQTEYDDYEINVVSSNKVVVSSINTNGVRVVKTFNIPNEGYMVETTIRFENLTDSSLVEPNYFVSTGALYLQSIEAVNPADISFDTAEGLSDVALDYRVRESNENDFDVSDCDLTKLAEELFGGSGGGCSSIQVDPKSSTIGEEVDNMDVEWVSLRNRFFVQFLAYRGQENGNNSTFSKYGNGVKFYSTRIVNPESVSSFVPDSAAIAMRFPAVTIPANGSVEQKFSLYVGPRKLSELKGIAEDSVDVMNFGTWDFFCIWLLEFLVFIAGIFGGDYGIAIIVLTIIVRLILYPINRKSVAGMRKMQEVQPLIKEINEKYKDDPQQRQREMMRIYSEHKINPLASCLPMLIQLPIFLALFNILGSAIELRYESFLWIPDLSSPENLFRDSLGFGVNILPILMAVTMGLQTSLSPSSGDPSQRKMMVVFMPIFMLFIFYSMPSALTLYWTVSQILAIIGMLWYNKRHPIAKTQEDGVEVIAPPRETRQMRRNKK